MNIVDEKGFSPSLDMSL